MIEKLKVIIPVLVVYVLIITIIGNLNINYINHPWLFLLFSPVGLIVIAVLAATWLSGG